jgi:hypothetical protein
MKKLFSLVIAAIVLVTVSSCNKTATPKEVAEKFLNHIQKKEYADAKKLATTESASTIDMMQSFGSMGGEQKEAKIEVKDEKIDGDKATVKYMEDGAEKTLDLVKIDNEWKVEMKKETPPAETTEETPADSTATTDAPAQ